MLTPDSFLKGYPDTSARLVTLKNRNGLVAQFTNYGARWVSMWVPDSLGRFTDVVLGFDSLAGYISAGEKYHGAMVGRVCGRLNNASFVMDDKTYHLASNDVYGKPVRNHLHGGRTAFHNQFWKVAESCNREGEESVTFILYLKDGEEGYPGNLEVEVTYTLTNRNSIRLVCQVKTDRKTPVNITNHTFFNLSPQLPKSIFSQHITLNASTFIDCNEELIPTGKLVSVEDTYLDFRKSQTLAKSLELANDQVRKDRGFSVAFVLDKEADVMGLAAVLEDKESHRRMELYTNQPSLQVYNGYFMDGSDVGHEGVCYFSSAGVALEPQGFPDAPNQPGFPSIFIDKEKPYRQENEYCFYWENN